MVLVDLPGSQEGGMVGEWHEWTGRVEKGLRCAPTDHRVTEHACGLQPGGVRVGVGVGDHPLTTQGGLAVIGY